MTFPPQTRIWAESAALALVLGACAALLAGGLAAATTLPENGAPGMNPCADAPVQAMRETDRPTVPLDESVKVSPAVIDQRGIEAGSTLLCAIEIRNRHAVRTTFELVPVGVEPGTDPRGPAARFLREGDPGATDTAASWLHPAVDDVTLAPRGVARVPVRIEIPADAAGGGHFAALAVRQRGSIGAGADAPLGLATDIAVMVLLTIEGDVRRDFDLVSVQAPGVVWNRRPYRLLARTRNTGNVHLRPVGVARVKSVFGGTVAELPIEGRTMLPGGSSLVRTTWRGVPWFGYYRMNLQLRPATVVEGKVVPDIEGPARRRTVHFWALPPLWVLIAIGATLLLLLALWLLGRRRRDADGGVAEHDNWGA